MGKFKRYRAGLQISFLLPVRFWSIIRQIALYSLKFVSNALGCPMRQIRKFVTKTPNFSVAVEFKANINIKTGNENEKDVEKAKERIARITQLEGEIEQLKEQLSSRF
ncbi:unnamed protein product [Caenorhabditis auriculariae]|uniref:Uncharacterized protein n=1 Tax=Caenorhabditis auriculariae TaxID=2777116 RepID=A0A8S1HNV1_9PELO|nr:unnamed protein product [Caenorhabditis auriculariae]